MLNFQTGQEIKTGTIGSDGWCSLSGIPSGSSLAIVVNGTRGGKTYRLSLLIPIASSIVTQYVVDPVSSIAAEAFCGNATIHNFANNMVFCADDLIAVTNAAAAFVQAHTASDFSVGGEVFSTTPFGQAGSLDSNNTNLNAVTGAVQTIHSNLAKAKNMVNQMQEAGAPLKAMVDPESLDFRAVLTQQVLDKYKAIATGIGKLLLPR